MSLFDPNLFEYQSEEKYWEPGSSLSRPHFNPRFPRNAFKNGPSIHLNPHFRGLYEERVDNDLFDKNSVHVNPHVIGSVWNYKEGESSTSKLISPSSDECFFKKSNNFLNDYKSNETLNNYTKSITSMTCNNKYKYIRNNVQSTNKNNLVKCQNIGLNNLLNVKADAKSLYLQNHIKTKYKIVKNRVKDHHNKLKTIQMLKTVKRKYLHSNTWRRLIQPCSKAQIKKVIKHQSKKKRTNLSLVNIDGIKYRSTTKVLMRVTQSCNNVLGRKLLKKNKHDRSRNKFFKGNKCLKIINKDGERTQKFVTDGRRLKRLSLTKIAKTSLSKSERVRQMLNTAKQRSIKCFIKKRSKNNLPCLLYNKLGKCYKLEKNICPYVHLKENISLCKKHLMNSCNDPSCLLSHNIVQEKVATCSFFLQGLCIKENCPFLHVKVNPKAEICKLFLNGFCADGKLCKKRHVNVCPDYDKSKQCKSGKQCPYPHKTDGIQTVKKSCKQPVEEVQENVRYYQKSNAANDEVKLVQVKLTNKPERILPSYIALNNSSF